MNSASSSIPNSATVPTLSENQPALAASTSASATVPAAGSQTTHPVAPIDSEALALGGSKSSSPSPVSDSDDDWLMSDGETAGPSSTQLRDEATRSMAERDSAKVQSQFHDTGYREGITAGKLSTLQDGFNQGFNEVGAPIGRTVGNLRGQISVLLSVVQTVPASQEDKEQTDADVEADHDDGAATSSHTAPETRTQSRKASARARVRGGLVGRARADEARNKLALPFLQSEKLPAARELLLQLSADVENLTLHQVAPPDYAALEHDAEHLAEASGKQPDPVLRETAPESQAREATLSRLQQRLQHVYEMLNLRAD